MFIVSYVTALCHKVPYIDVNHDYNSNSHLYNSMVHPFHKMSIKGAVWYQGEANSFWNPDKYQCMLKNVRTQLNTSEILYLKVVRVIENVVKLIGCNGRSELRDKL